MGHLNMLTGPFDRWRKYLVARRRYSGERPTIAVAGLNRLRNLDVFGKPIWPDQIHHVGRVSEAPALRTQVTALPNTGAERSGVTDPGGTLRLRWGDGRNGGRFSISDRRWGSGRCSCGCRCFWGSRAQPW